MFSDGLEKLGSSAKAKVALCNRSAFKYFLLSMMAGVFISFGVMLVYVLAAPFSAVSAPSTKLIMSITFSSALLMVIFAGAELFTSNTMTLVVGTLRKEIKQGALWKCLLICYVGNLAGCLLMARLAVWGGVFDPAPVSELLLHVAEGKVNLLPQQILIKAMFCNMLICLAVWMSYRTKDEAARILLIVFAIITFYASGFEHSIVNMNTLAIALLIPHGADITLAHYVYSVGLASIGNFIGGAICIGGFYYYIEAGHKQ